MMILTDQSKTNKMGLSAIGNFSCFGKTETKKGFLYELESIIKPKELMKCRRFLYFKTLPEASIK